MYLKKLYNKTINNKISKSWHNNIVSACVIGHVKTFNMKETEKIGIKIKLMVMDIIAKSSQAKHDLVC